MTDTTAEQPPWSANVRAEMARAGVTRDDMLAAMPERIRIGRGAWALRMRVPDRWRLAELQAIAGRLGIPLERLLDDPSQ